MADLYVCPDCGRSYPDMEAFVRHSEVSDHARDDGGGHDG